MTLVADSGPAFKNKFEEECAKMDLHVEHSSAYNPSSQAAKIGSSGAASRASASTSAALDTAFS